VRTRISLTDGEKSQLANRLQAAVGKQVILEETTDANLLAASSPRSAVSFSTAVSTGSSRACASGW